MKVRIFTEKPGWILHRMALEIANRIPGTVVNGRLRDADIHYFINYGYFRETGERALRLACFTHYDPNHLADSFRTVAEQVDHCVAISAATADILKQFGIPDERISTIIIGADVSFRPALTLGIAGRTYAGGRKGEALVAALLADAALMDGLRIVAGGEGWGVPVRRCESAADFYRSVDYLLVPSLIEGGPVPFMEAIACGTPAIAPPVGVVPEFPHLEYPVGDIGALKRLIADLKRKHLETKRELSETMLPYTWERWGREHETLFARLLHQRGAKGK